MKFLKYLLFIVLGLLAIYLVLCAMGDKKIATTQSTIINASAESVFEELADFDRQQAWSPWVKMDTAMTIANTGTPGTVGYTSNWKSKKMGDGNQKMVEVRTNEYIKTEVRFVDWGDEPGIAELKLAPEGEGTKVTWTMDGSEPPFIFRGMTTLMGGTKMMEEQYNLGLASLKALVEAKPKSVAVAYEVVDIQDTWYVGQVHKGVSMESASDSLYGAAYNAIGKAAGDKISGAPICIARNINYETKMMNLEMAMPTSAEVKASEGLTSGMIPAGRCTKYKYVGPYEQVAAAWDAYAKQVEKDGLKYRWDAYEVYEVGPASGADPSTYITYLMMPVE